MTDLAQALAALEATAQADLAAAADAAPWKQVRVRYLGRKGSLATILRGLGELDRGRAAGGGQAGQRGEAAAGGRAGGAPGGAGGGRRRRRPSPRSGWTSRCPGGPCPMGRLHPSTQVLRRICQIWADMGFQIYRSRDVESDEMNFELLNIPAHHPARDMWDTFYTTTDGVLLRTHTSPGQIRAMREYCPEPIRVILPGMCYRYEQITARSEIQFHQVEGLAVGRNITMTDLKGTLISFAHRMFGAERRVRFRASHFPFTEPSAEMDVECMICGGDGLRHLQAERVAGDPGLRDGAPAGAAERRLRPRRLLGLRLRHGARAHHHAAATASRTSATSGGTTSVSWSSSDREGDAAGPHSA